MSETMPAIAFLGAGAMGGAILRGYVASGRDHGGITVTNRTKAKAVALADLSGVTSVALETDPDGNTAAAAGADIVLAGVKPAMMPDLLTEIAPRLRPGATVVSLAVGVAIATMEAILPAGTAVVRSMPNTPARVGKGVTGLAASETATAEAVAQVRALFETVGAVVQVPEAQIDALSTISGSGPAYVFLFTELLTRAAEAKGFTPEQARVLARQTVIGSAALLESSPLEADELRRQVTSPAGTTERAVAVLESAGLDELIDRATDAALARARELSAAR